MVKALDISGKRFGLLIVDARAISTTGRSRWICKCDCGQTTEVDGSELVRGKVRSCGCATALLIGQANTKHGMSSTRTYRAWAAMLNRCKDLQKEHYGKRGITVCKRWQVFENFYADMGEAPAGRSIDRKNNNRGYSKSNCHWATTYEQNKNRSNSRLIEFNGVVDTVAAHAQRAGLKYDTVHYRIFRRGWSIAAALTTQPFGTRVEVPL